MEMDDPLLSSLCRICNINLPKYTCPRCSLQTCSLPCLRRHKLWSSCSGIRDPTVYKSKSQLATPSGIDHDYNFLHTIEHRIERSEKEIVQDRGLVEKGELERARRAEEPDWRDQKRKRKLENPGEVPIERSLKFMRTLVERAPKGMRRSVENGTSWGKNQKCINWQVEWIREGNGGRVLSKAMGNKPIGEVYAALQEEERKKSLTNEEKISLKKLKADEKKRRLAKKVRPNGHENIDLTTSPTLQDPQTGAWSFASTNSPILGTIVDELPTPKLPIPSFYFYLRRPHTPSSFPKILVPLDATKPLETLLKRRVVVEFPTIYVLESGPQDLPEQFMLERDYLAAIGQQPWQDSDTEMAEVKKDSEEDEAEDETSSSGSDSDEDMEEGEIV